MPFSLLLFSNHPGNSQSTCFASEAVSFGVNAHAGAILADDMGLGKTLQSITLLWTLLNSGNELLGGKPVAKRVIICCPTSLVSNWDSEIQKWLKVKAPACCVHLTAEIHSMHLT